MEATVSCAKHRHNDSGATYLIALRTGAQMGDLSLKKCNSEIYLVYRDAKCYASCVAATEIMPLLSCYGSVLWILTFWTGCHGTNK